jgi:hypothetical protein
MKFIYGRTINLFLHCKNKTLLDGILFVCQLDFLQDPFILPCNPRPAGLPGDHITIPIE